MHFRTSASSVSTWQDVSLLASTLASACLLARWLLHASQSSLSLFHQHPLSRVPSFFLSAHTMCVVSAHILRVQRKQLVLCFRCFQQELDCSLCVISTKRFSLH